MQPKAFKEETTRSRLETFPGAGRADRVMDGQFNETIALRRAVLEENWPQVAELAVRCLGLGYGSFRALRSEAVVAARTARNTKSAGNALANMLRAAAKGERRAEFFAKIRELAAERRPDHLDKLEESLQKLEQGETRGVPILQALAEFEPPSDAPGRQGAESAAIMALSRGMLGMVHAEFNLAFQALKPKAKPLLELDLQDSFKAAVEDFKADLRAGQHELYAALLAHRSKREAAQAACSLAGMLEERLPRFTRAQAHVALVTRALRAQGKGGAAEKLGHQAMQAGALTREAIASHAASYQLALGLLAAEPPSGVARLYKQVSTLPFDVALPNGRDTALAKVDQAQDGDFVEVEGFVAAIRVGRSADKKLLSHVELYDPSSKARAYAASVYTHLPHVGVTLGAFCRLSGTYRQASILFHNRPAIEIDRLSLADLSDESWWVAFLRSAERWFQCWPNGINMYWSLEPHRRARADSETDYFGAGDLIYSPLLRR